MTEKSELIVIRNQTSMQHDVSDNNIFFCNREKFELDLVRVSQAVLSIGCTTLSVRILSLVNIFVNCFCFVAFDKVSKESGDSFYIK